MARCPFCMCDSLNNGICRVCGYPESKQLNRMCLPIGTVLQNRYELGGALQAGFQSIAYVAYDRNAGATVLVSEFFPKNLAGRGGLDVFINRNHALFAQACGMYIAAPAPEGFRLTAAFEENNTGYRVFALPGGAEQALQLADQLLDHPVYFRGSDGRPMMSVNALEIPPLPPERPYNGNHASTMPEARDSELTLNPATMERPDACAVP